MDSTIHWITQLLLLVFIHCIVTYPVDSVIHLLNNRGQHYIIFIYISNFHHFENVIKMRETGYDDLISNRCFIHGHRGQSVMGCVSSEQADEELNSLASFVKFNCKFPQN